MYKYLDIHHYTRWWFHAGISFNHKYRGINTLAVHILQSWTTYLIIQKSTYNNLQRMQWECVFDIWWTGPRIGPRTPQLTNYKNRDSSLMAAVASSGTHPSTSVSCRCVAAKLARVRYNNADKSSDDEMLCQIVLVGNSIALRKQTRTMSGHAATPVTGLPPKSRVVRGQHLGDLSWALQQGDRVNTW